MSDRHDYEHLTPDEPKPNHPNQGVLKTCTSCQMQFFDYSEGAFHTNCSVCAMFGLTDEDRLTVDEEREIELEDIEAGDAAITHYQNRVEAIIDELVPPELFPNFTRMSARSILRTAQHAEYSALAN